MSTMQETTIRAWQRFGAIPDHDTTLRTVSSAWPQLCINPLGEVALPDYHWGLGLDSHAECRHVVLPLEAR